MGGFLRKTFGQLRKPDTPVGAPVAAAAAAAAAAPAPAAAARPSIISAAVKTPSLIGGRSNIFTSPQGVVDEELKIKRRKLGAGKPKA